jgi:S1-C subfamily serine protease
VNPGSIGAPVVDLTGDLVGIAANAITADGGQTVVIPYDAVRAAYQKKNGKGAKVVGRPPPPRPVADRIDDDLGRVLEDAATRAARALVAVRALPLEGEAEAPLESPPDTPPEPGKPPPGPPMARRVPGAERAYDRASGLVVGEDGVVLTSLRVTGWPHANRPLAVDLADGQSYPATVLGSDERLRLVLLKIDAKGLVPLEPAPETGFRAGRLAVALGYPHMRPGKDTPQLTFGILSRAGALSNLHPAFEALATDAGVSESNRGGPLVDIDGRLLGILVDVNDTNLQGYVTRARGAYAGNAGLGFAVPWPVVERILPRLRVGAVLKAGILGVSTADTPDGLEVVNVAEKNSQGQPTGAKEAGIARGDILLAVDGKPVRRSTELRAILAAFSEGDRVTLRLRRAGAELEVPVILGEP